MRIANHEDYAAAVERAASLDGALPNSEQGREFERLTLAIREWDEQHKGKNAQGPEPHESTLTVDDLPFSGLPGNLGKLNKD
jgi:hypothetical protein